MNTLKNKIIEAYKKHPIWYTIGILFFIGILASNDEKPKEVKQESVVAPVVKPISVYATDLVADYTANEVAADQKYKGKKLEIEGVVDDIKKDITDEIYVTLLTNDPIRSVQCFVKDENVAASLRRGDVIKVQGYCRGLMMNVLVYDCVVQ